MRPKQAFPTYKHKKLPRRYTCSTVMRLASARLCFASRICSWRAFHNTKYIQIYCSVNNPKPHSGPESKAEILSKPQQTVSLCP